MSTAVYKIFDEDAKYYFELHVSKTPELMRENIDAIFKSSRLRKKDFSNTLGMFSPILHLDRKQYGYMFLNEECLVASIVAHECLHAAFAYERFVAKKRTYYGTECGKSEERLAYTFSYIVRSVYTTLYDNNHIKEA